MAQAKIWTCAEYRLDLSRPLIMGILNATTDSFSDGGDFFEINAAVDHAKAMVDAGAAIIDVGGQSTRPGAVTVSVEEELRRVIPLVEKLLPLGVPISVDTFEPIVMREAAAAGASIINDVYGLQKPGAMEAVAQSNCGVCIMHMQGCPATMQVNPVYDDMFTEVENFLQTQAKTLESLGVSFDRICLDPGFGFGKTVAQNFELLQRTAELVDLGYPVLYGMSRKSSLGAVTGKTVPKDRLISSVTAHILAINKGAQIVRVHDVPEMAEAIKVWESTEYFKEIV